MDERLSRRSGTEGSLGGEIFGFSAPPGSHCELIPDTAGTLAFPSVLPVFSDGSMQRSCGSVVLIEDQASGTHRKRLGAALARPFDRHSKGSGATIDWYCNNGNASGWIEVNQKALTAAGIMLHDPLPDTTLALSLRRYN